MRVRRTSTRLVAAFAAVAIAVTLTAAATPGSASPSSGAEAAAAQGGGSTKVLEAVRSPTPGGRSRRWRCREPACRPTTSPATSTPTSRSAFTSPTNIGAYLWSTVAARDTGLIGKREARTGWRRPSTSIGKLERHEPSGMFYNWYDPTTLEKLRIWPENGDGVKPFLSRVDNGWLATGLLLAARAEPALADEGRRDPRGHELRLLLQRGRAAGRPDPRRLLGRGPERGRRRSRATTAAWAPTSGTPATTTAPSTPSRGSRRTSASPPARSRPSTTSAPSAPSPTTTATGPGPRPSRSASGRATRTTAVDVFEGALPYRGMKIVPTWGGSMFEALMVPLFVPEEKWGPRSWGATTRSTCAARSSTAWTRPTTATGASRRPTTPPAATASTASTCSACDGQPRLHLRPGADRLGPAVRGLPRGQARARRRTATAWSPRTRRSWRCATRRRPRWRTCANISATSTPTARAASTTRSPSGAGRSRSATCRSTRAW